MVDEKILAFLMEFHPDKRPHSKKTLLSHLCGTHDLLQSWGNPRHVCLAGLFHGIYGTTVYPYRSASIRQRERIRAVIGADAEWLVYLFCVGPRPFLLTVSKPQPRIYDLKRQEEIILSLETQRNLLEIETANRLEEMLRYTMHRETLEQLSAGIEAAKGLISADAYHAMNRALAEKSATQPSLSRRLAHSMVRRSKLLNKVVHAVRLRPRAKYASQTGESFEP
ncbi:MAG: DUF6817 domain-containing protein [Candidatus Binataceae bacterium]